ncbi:MAG TPA: NDP-sugar synthase [Polyangiales bacterium]|nr:NDP-sugar synthase [Polyangiales bacterium]
MTSRNEFEGVRAMLVTAGYGTRLAPLTDFLPKPAVPVANRPLAWFALDHLYRLGFRELSLNTHHLATKLEHEIERWAPNDLHLRFVFEPEILGTGGGIRNTWGRPESGEIFLAMNGKYVFAPDLRAALREHRARNAIATMVLTHAPGVRGFGDVEIDAEGWVRRFRRAQPEAAERADLRPMFYTGLALYSERAFRDLPQNGDLITDACAGWVARGEPVFGYVDEGVCRDAGMSLWHYWEANEALLNGNVHWPGIVPSTKHGICDPEAELGAGAQIVRSAIGRDAVVAPGVRVTDSVIWPGAHVTDDVTRSVVLPGGLRLAVPAGP